MTPLLRVNPSGPAFQPGDRVETIPHAGTVTRVREVRPGVFLYTVELDDPGFGDRRLACGARAIRKAGEA